MYFIFNASKSGTKYNKTHVIDKLEGNNIDISLFKDYVVKHIEAKELAFTTQTPNEYIKSESIHEDKRIMNQSSTSLSGIDSSQLTGAELIEYQKKQLAKLEREELRKKKEEAQKK